MKKSEFSFHELIEHINNLNYLQWIIEWDETLQSKNGLFISAIAPFKSTEKIAVQLKSVQYLMLGYYSGDTDL